MGTQRGLITIEELRLGDKVQTIHNQNILMTNFLGWLHKDANHTERFLKLKTESVQITLSKKHVIFYKKKGMEGDNMATTFADRVEEGDLLEVISDGKVQWERVVDIDSELRKEPTPLLLQRAPSWWTISWHLVMPTLSTSQWLAFKSTWLNLTRRKQAYFYHSPSHLQCW